MSDRRERLRREAWKWLGMAQEDLTGARYGAIGCGTRGTLVPCSYVRTRPAMYRGPGQTGVRLGWTVTGVGSPSGHTVLVLHDMVKAERQALGLGNRGASGVA